MGAEEILFGARPAFGGHIRVAAVPFEWLGSGQILQRAIVDDVFAESIRLEVPLEAVDGRINVAIGTAEGALEGKLRGVEQAFPATQGVDLLWAAEIDSRDHFLAIGVDNRDSVIQAIGDIQALAIGREYDSARIMADGNSRRNVIRRCGEIIDEGLTTAAHGLEQAWDIDYGNALSSRCGQEQLRFLWRNRYSPGQGIVAIEFIQRDLDHAAHVRSKHSKGIAEYPAVLHVGERYQIFRPELSHCGELAIGRSGEMECARHIVQGLPFDNRLRRCINDRDL